MQRRDMLKRIGASSALAVGASGVGSARQIDALGQSNTIAPEEAEYLTTEINGETLRLTPEEFDRHPDTKALSDVDLSSSCCYQCCECCDVCCPNEVCCCGSNCGSCSGC